MVKFANISDSVKFRRAIDRENMIARLEFAIHVNFSCQRKEYIFH